eukprot:GFYU01003255.1.p1 GENE.GFYU01003255.1~~GFYU01003255.1.p1  ORF type:complete len:478 (-),score=148.59 GFYU01003255.1:64-1344(-)
MVINCLMSVVMAPVNLWLMCCRFIQGVVDYIKHLWDGLHVFHSQKLLTVDKIDMGKVIRSYGYPFEEYDVETDDGYILKLQRIPNPTAHTAVYIQHGVLDTAYSWIAAGPTASLAFRLHDEGYDIWLGNFRGTGHNRHKDENITQWQYWDFCLNDHAFEDIPAFVRTVRETKAEELGRHETDPTINLTTIAHSMGASATIIYLIHCITHNIPHHMTNVMLLSPAGVHKKAPALCKITGPVIDATVSNWIPAFSLRSDSAIGMIVKLVEDIKRLPAMRALFSWMLALLLGGDSKENPFTYANSMALNTLFSGTSSKVFKHFWQIFKTGRFQPWDYGKEKNLEMYGSEQPPNYLELYHTIDIPVHFILGLQDKLIDPVNIIHHYQCMKEQRPEFASVKMFADVGHIDFTYGLSDDHIGHIRRRILTPP